MKQKSLKIICLLVIFAIPAFGSKKNKFKDVCVDVLGSIRVSRTVTIGEETFDHAVSYDRTNRTLREVLPAYVLPLAPTYYVDRDFGKHCEYGCIPMIDFMDFARWQEEARAYLKGKRVLDVATGDGQFVRDIRKLGADADGVDLHLKPSQKKQKFFLERDMLDTKYPDSTFDLVFSTAGPFHYFSYHGSSPELFNETLGKGLAEMVRVTKPDGMILLFPTDRDITYGSDPSNYYKIYPKKLVEEYCRAKFGNSVEVIDLPSFSSLGPTHFTIAGKEGWNGPNRLTNRVLVIRKMPDASAHSTANDPCEKLKAIRASFDNIR
jgi:SAM-dependent methyltransferase